jgi:very-short-patch-repair endonuclease
MTDFDRILAHLAAKQAGAFTTRQALDAGVSSAALARRRDRGVIELAFPAIWVFRHARDEHETRRWAALLAAGDGAMLAREAAAQLWEISRRRDRHVELLVIKRTRPIPGARIRQTSTFHPEDLAYIGRRTVTSVERTIVDLADERSSSELCRYLREAAFREILDMKRLERTMSRNAGRHGAGRMHRALEWYLHGDGGTDSHLEERFIRMLRRAGVSDAVSNYECTIGGETLRPDVFVPSAHLVIEIDPNHHLLPPTTREDRLKDALYASAGHRSLRLPGKRLRHSVSVALQVIHTAKADAEARASGTATLIAEVV